MKDQIEDSSGNVYTDLGVPHPEEELAKAKIVSRICDIIEQRGLTQRQAAEILGITQPKVSALASGKLHGFSSDRLFRFLNALDRDVEIIIKPKRRASARASVRVVLAA